VTSYEASSWNGLLAPKNTPVEIRERLNGVINAGLAHPKVKARLADLGAATLPGSPDDFGNLIHRGNRKVEEVVRVANIKAEQTANP
jgi:tripartite-type tricarboxylate transporter receptor subunit TctC